MATALVLTLAVAAGAGAYLTSNHHSAKPATRAARASASQSSTSSAHTAAAPSGATATSKGPAFSASAARRDIVGLLDSYQSAYSEHSAANLARILASSVTRHGLAASGCTVSHGLRAVLGNYQSQFRAGTGAYKLDGLSQQAIVFDGTTEARINAHYEITPGGSGFVNFKFAEAGHGWKISEIYATCS